MYFYKYEIYIAKCDFTFFFFSDGKSTKLKLPGTKFSNSFRKKKKSKNHLNDEKCNETFKISDQFPSELNTSTEIYWLYRCYYPEV